MGDFDDDPDKALYVHLASDGGILLIRGDTGEQLWTDRDGLRLELEKLRSDGVSCSTPARRAIRSRPPTSRRRSS